jgi:hypothetical protein
VVVLALVWVFVSRGGRGELDDAARSLPRRVGAELAPLEAPPAPEDALPVETAEDERATPWSLFQLRGRVLSRADEEPLADVLVRVLSADGLATAFARSDEGGAFELAYRGPPDARAQPLPKRGWVPEGPPLRVTDAQLAGDEEIVLHLMRGHSEPVGGKVVAKSTHQGVRDALVQVAMTAFALEEEVRTDLEGRFRTELSFPEGEVSVTVLDRIVDSPSSLRLTTLGTAARAHLEDGRLGETWIVEVDVGPSYVLGSRDGPPIDATFTARLQPQEAEQEVAAVLDVERRGFRLIDADELEDPENEIVVPDPWPEIPVRSGDEGRTPWIRYPRPLHPPLEGVDFELLVRGGTKWVGTAPVQTIEGHQAGVVAVPLRATSALVGRVLDTTDAGVADAQVLLFEPGPRDRPPFRTTLTGSDGGFELVDVDARDWRLVVRPRQHPGEELAVDLVPGRVALDPIVLPAAPVMGDVAGELFVPAGVPHDRPYVTLASSEGSSWRSVEIARPSGAGAGADGTTYRFLFPNVPSGEYDLTVGSFVGRGGTSDAFWTPRRWRVFPPRGDVFFECRADDEPQEFSFVVSDALDRPVRGAEVTFGPGGWLTGNHDVGRRAFRIPRDATLAWRVTAQGCQPVYGDESDVRSAKDARAEVVVRLRRGYGATLHVLSLPEGVNRNAFRRAARGSLGGAELLWDAFPVPGARVYADGQPVGTTDREGRIDLALQARPERVTVRADGWMGLDVTMLGRSAHTEAVLWCGRHEVVRLDAEER